MRGIPAAASVLRRLKQVARGLIVLMVGAALAAALALLNCHGDYETSTGQGLLVIVTDPAFPKMADGSPGHVYLHGWPFPMLSRETQFAVSIGGPRHIDDLWWPSSPWLFEDTFALNVLATRPMAIAANIVICMAMLALTIWGCWRWLGRARMLTLSVADAIWMVTAVACALAMLQGERPFWNFDEIWVRDPWDVSSGRDALFHQMSAGVVGLALGFSIRAACGLIMRARHAVARR